ncbi:MAG: hypothetical protein GWN01_13470 [Nitrosopumilaceae archaeon]|nr:hypothetical protein [Nitrosopumilaceae archaeon]NIU01873.1 hypothetical protein [Nitrosopumilaceae archaeon]NIU88277.1 hypothetical protein [Nitrosopumilaceae archaeon]NIV66569.1 hypothetical protein [Nitrosopumilaceae archaeon]NIX62474.1 hypothetical protein [Nitrosopumilaceae archaeon]
MSWPNPVQWGRDHYVFITTLVALGTAGVDLKILLMMSDSLDKGLGLAAIGTVTFFGALLFSSFFEEHRHKHKNPHINLDGMEEPEKNNVIKKLKQLESDFTQKKIKEINDLEDKKKNETDEKKKDNIDKELAEKYNELLKNPMNKLNMGSQGKKSDSSLIGDIIAGRGIMRKALASSLVITYIVLIGLSYSDATLYDQFITPDTEENEDADNSNENGNQESSEGTASSLDSFIYSMMPVATGQSSGNPSDELSIEDSVKIEKQSEEEPSEEDGSIDHDVMMKLLEKNPQSLVQHFTIVVSVVIGFYFGSNALNALIQRRQSDG